MSQGIAIQSLCNAGSTEWLAGKASHPTTIHIRLDPGKAFGVASTERGL